MLRASVKTCIISHRAFLSCRAREQPAARPFPRFPHYSLNAGTTSSPLGLYKHLLNPVGGLLRALKSEKDLRYIHQPRSVLLQGLGMPRRGVESITKCSWVGAGVLEDISARLHCYKADWADGIASGFRYCLFRQCLSLVLVAHSTQTIALARLAYILAQSDSDIVQLLLKQLLLPSRILAPAAYIFCASAVPAFAFGAQMSVETGD